MLMKKSLLTEQQSNYIANAQRSSRQYHKHETQVACFASNAEGVYLIQHYYQLTTSMCMLILRKFLDKKMCKSNTFTMRANHDHQCPYHRFPRLNQRTCSSNPLAVSLFVNQKLEHWCAVEKEKACENKWFYPHLTIQELCETSSEHCFFSILQLQSHNFDEPQTL